MVFADFYAKIDIHPCFAIQTLKTNEFAKKNLVIANFYAKVDIHPCFAI